MPWWLAVGLVFVAVNLLYDAHREWCDWQIRRRRHHADHQGQ